MILRRRVHGQRGEAWDFTPPSLPTPRDHTADTLALLVVIMGGILAGGWWLAWG